MEIKKELLDELLKDYQKPEDVIGENGLLKQLTKALLERAMSAELTNHLGYEKNDPAGYHSGNSRNGATPKTLKGDFGEMLIETPRDRNGSFEPQIIKKHQTRFDGFDEKILSMYARGMTTREIQGHLQEMYGVEVSPTLISEVTDGVMEEVKAWQNRPLDPVYGVVYLDALYVKMRHEGRVENRAVYVAIGIGLDGQKDVLGLWTSNNEGAKFWLAVLTELKNRGVKEILIACVDGLKGFPQAIESVFLADGGTAMHCAPGAGESELRELEGTQAGGCRFEGDLPGGNGGASGDGVEYVPGQVGIEVPGNRQALEGELGADHTLLRISGRGTEGDLHDQCGRIAAHESAQNHQDAGLISERGGGPQADLPGAAQRHPEMGHGAGLEAGAEPLPDAVGRPHPDSFKPLNSGDAQRWGRIPAIGQGRKWPAAARNWDAPFPVSPSGGKPGRAGSPHAGSTLRGQQKALARIMRRLPPQEGCRPLVNPLRARYAGFGNLRDARGSQG
jgi:putative transposase